MTFDEVFPAFKAGKKIKVGKWPEGSYFQIVGKDYHHQILGLNDADQRAKFIASMLRSDWEVIEDVNERSEPTEGASEPADKYKPIRRRLRE